MKSSTGSPGPVKGLLSINAGPTGDRDVKAFSDAWTGNCFRKFEDTNKTKGKNRRMWSQMGVSLGLKEMSQ